jgi:hypothetical protein
MPISATTVLRHIERKLGVSHHTLELERDDLIRTIVEETIPTFSLYFPLRRRLLVEPGKDDVEGRYGVYYLKSEFEIIGISRVLINNIEAGIPNITNYYNNPFEMQIDANIQSSVINPTTYNWEKPDKIEIFPKNTFARTILVETKVVHPSHMTTIPLNLRDEFNALAYYDVCESLYPIRKRFSQIGTTFGSIELFMDQLEQASDKRTELLEKWKLNFLKSPERKKFFIY